MKNNAGLCDLPSMKHLVMKHFLVALLAFSLSPSVFAVAKPNILHIMAENMGLQDSSVAFSKAKLNP